MQYLFNWDADNKVALYNHMVRGFNDHFGSPSPRRTLKMSLPFQAPLGTVASIIPFNVVQHDNYL